MPRGEGTGGGGVEVHSQGGGYPPPGGGRFEVWGSDRIGKHPVRINAHDEVNGVLGGPKGGGSKLGDPEKSLDVTGP